MPRNELPLTWGNVVVPDLHDFFLEELQVTNYRSLANVGLALNGLNVIIGPNGSGKTTVLDLLAFVAAGMRGELAAAITARGGLSDLLTLNAKPDASAPEVLAANRADFLRITAGLRVVSPQSRGVYQFELKQRGQGYEIARESLILQGSDDEQLQPLVQAGQASAIYGGSGATNLFHDWDQLALAQVPKTDELAVAELVRRHFASASYYGPLDTNTNSPIRLPQTPEPNQYEPGRHGEHLVSVLSNLDAYYPDIFQRLIDILGAAFPDFESLKCPSVAAGKLTMTWRTSVFAQPFYPHQLSEGTLHFLWLLTLLLSPKRPSIILLDEPELSLHPDLIMILAGVLQEAALHSQVFVATHSDNLIRWLQPSDVVVLDKVDGFTVPHRANDPKFDIERWLADYSLDQLWLMGHLGGRPE